MQISLIDSQPSERVSTKKNHLAGRIVADLHELLIDELDASQTGRLEQAYLRFDEQLERNFGEEEAWPGTFRVPDGGADIAGGEVARRVDALEGVAEDVVEDVVDPGAAAELFRRGLWRGTVDGRDKVTHKLRHQGEDKRAAMLFAQEGAPSERVQFLLRLAHERVQARLHVWQLVPDVRHQDLVERLGQEPGTAAMRKIPVGRMGPEEL